MKAKILLVEDDKDTRDIYEEVLVDAGFVVDTAVDGAFGLEKASKGGYDMILLDLMMPNVDGLQFLERIGENPPKTPNGPILVLTNVSQDSVVQKALDLGATAYFIKANINPEQLLKEVRSFLLDSSAK
ncbi:response regulator [Candidatus Microgenomates bacterium]|nr:response regulator [Candidatus Microgenomates bacterium]